MNTEVNLRLLICGMPGAGKGYLIKNLKRVLNNQKKTIAQIHCKDIIKEDPLCRQFAEKGELLPDELVISIFRKKLEMTKGNIALDGFPRTFNQAKALLDIDTNFVIWKIQVNQETVLQRVQNRITCHKCGETYSIIGKNAPHIEGICDSCGSKLERRVDEKQIQKRIEIYHKQTEPAIEFLTQHGLKCFVLDGTHLEQNDIERYINETIGWLYS